VDPAMENERKQSSHRLYSLDALRGFDMFWIMGGEAVFIALGSLTGWSVLVWWAGQLEHVAWHGFKFYDMIFPLFLFIAGISFPFSYRKRIAINESRVTIYRHILTRGLVLLLLGIIYNNGIRFDFENLRYGSVLGRIGLAWMFAALIFINTNTIFRIIWFCSLLLGYWILMVLFPAHDLGSADIYSMKGNLASFIDRVIMPGKLYRDIHDPEGFFSTLPAIGTTLMGMLTGEFMLSKRMEKYPLKKVLYLVSAGIGFVVIGKIWDLAFPINKNLWSSSFVCFVGGLSLVLFAVFYLIIDVWQIRKWAFFFVVIGVNPITIYLVNRIVSFRSANNFLFGGLAKVFPETWSPLIMGIGLTAIGWTFLYFLYRKKIFFRI
jgi:predicted acyltransferase